MADTGYKWDDAHSAFQKGAGNWTADAIADAATEAGDGLDCDEKAAVEITVTAAEDNTGAIDGDVTVSVLRDVDGTNYETVSMASYAANFRPVQNSTVYWSIVLSCAQWSKFNLSIENQSGQEIALTVKYKFATVPVAS